MHIGRDLEAPSRVDARVIWTIGEMKRRIAEPLHIVDLARAAGLSTSHFAHLFRVETGIAPGEFLLGLRMSNARALLERTCLTIEEVRSLVGCSESSHFARDFRRIHGMAPHACVDHRWSRSRPAASAEAS